MDVFYSQFVTFCWLGGRQEQRGTDMAQVAINPQWVDKNPPFADAEEARQWWRGFNGGFRNQEIDIDEWIGEVAAGHAFAPWHNRYRKAENFLAAGYVGLDFDTGDERSSFAYLTSDPFIASNATFMYTTPSHTDEHPKARVVFVYDRPISGRGDKQALLAQALVYRYASSDRKCVDPVRLFFGSHNCRVLKLDNRLTLETAATELVEPYNQYLAEQQALAEARARDYRVMGAAEMPDEWLRRRLESMLNQVRFAPEGEKHSTLHNIARAFGGYVAGGYLSRSDAASLLQEAIRSNPNNVRSLAQAYSLIEEKLDYGMRDPLYFTVRAPQPAQPARVAAVSNYFPSVREALETLGRPLVDYKISGHNWIDLSTGETGDVVDLFGAEAFGDKWDRTDDAMVQVILRRFEEAAGIGVTRAALPQARPARQDWGQAHSSYFRS